MKQISIGLLLLLLLYSCKNRVGEGQTSVSKEQIVASPIADTIPAIAYKDFLALNYDEFVAIYKDKFTENTRYYPKKEVTFIMNDLYDGTIGEFRVELYNYFSEKEVKECEILIKEVTWDLNPSEYLTIWYHREQKHWVPIQHLVYLKDTNF